MKDILRSKKSWIVFRRGPLSQIASRSLERNERHEDTKLEPLASTRAGERNVARTRSGATSISLLIDTNAVVLENAAKSCSYFAFARLSRDNVERIQ